MAYPQPRLPPLSTTEPPRHRRSKSMDYNNSAPEWYWKLSPILPQLWIRDSSLITPDIISELETAWLKYQTLGIQGKGDGGSRRAKTKAGRRKIEEEYSILEPEIRRAKEVALARYENFAIRGRDGSLDYHVEEAKEKVGLRNRAKGLVGKIIGSTDKLGQ
ncbi:hypothetical protein L207DRAFT_591258 [Hyaloscypha variabilis F]|jgi:hypothetical protein|uniref:Uncharacterized protein n=1 Tax=Hyaloscypha variabilis (strain UAMH 11265 / GT02V1 / F) TaxID=1149755 RepID=A0A2J6QZZ2_HYAVF|nr:hypothetical protein L207DRAFT_591258 [Hyaloscypha variabilis F]